jgi:hypothetical protein
MPKNKPKNKKIGQGTWASDSRCPAAPLALNQTAPGWPVE